MMKKTRQKITDTNVAVVETVERRQVFSKKQLEEDKVELEKRVADIDELLAVLAA